MSRIRQNKNDRKRQRRKDFSHGRDWSTPPQDQRGSYPKSNLAQRADADRRAQIAGIRTKLPTATWRTIYAIDPDPSVDIDLRPGAINYVKNAQPSRVQAIQDMIRLMEQKMLNQMLYGIGPASLPRDFGIERRPDLKREMKVGEILAYRCWKLIGNQLRSVYMHDDWNPGQIMIGRGIADWSERGIHAWKDLNSKKFNDYVRGYLSVENDPWRISSERSHSTIIVTGTVLLWGDVVEHEHGYRAEYAKINSIDWLYPDASLMGRERETLANLRKLYGVA